MSSFASGNLLLTEHTETVKEHMEKNSCLIRLNDRWICYLTPETNRKAAAALSHFCPLLYLDYPEDHGLRFAVYEKGNAVSQLFIQYDLLFDAASRIAREIHDDGYGRYFMKDMQAYYELAEEKPFDLSCNFAQLDVEKFRLFGCSNEDIQRLRQSLDYRRFSSLREYESLSPCMVNDCIEILSLREMYFVSWHDVAELGGDNYNILARK